MLQEPSEKKSPNCPESLDSGAVLYRKATVQSEKRKKFALLGAAKKSCTEVEVGYTTHKNWFLLRTLRSTNLAAKNCGARDCQCTGKVVFYSGWCSYVLLRYCLLLYSIIKQTESSVFVVVVCGI